MALGVFTLVLACLVAIKELGLVPRRLELTSLACCLGGSLFAVYLFRLVNRPDLRRPRLPVYCFACICMLYVAIELKTPGSRSDLALYGLFLVTLYFMYLNLLGE